jgi:hypothetical protein
MQLALPRLPSATASVTTAADASAITVMLMEQQRLMLDREDKLRQDADKLREQAAEARGRAEMRAEMQPKLAVEAISDEQLAALQARLQSLHAAKLLTDDELYSIEDTIADCVEVKSTAPVTMPAVDQVLKILSLSESIAADGSLARQLRRKFNE